MDNSSIRNSSGQPPISGDYHAQNAPEAKAPEQSAVSHGHRFSTNSIKGDSVKFTEPNLKAEGTQKKRNFFKRLGSSIAKVAARISTAISSVFRSKPKETEHIAGAQNSEVPAEPSPEEQLKPFGEALSNAKVSWGKEDPKAFLAGEREARKAKEVPGIKGNVSGVGYADCDRMTYQWPEGVSPRSTMKKGDDEKAVFTQAIFEDLNTKFNHDEKLKNLSDDQKNDLAHTIYAGINQAFEQPAFEAMADTAGKHGLSPPQDLKEQDEAILKKNGIAIPESNVRTYTEGGQVHIESTRNFKLASEDNPGEMIGLGSFTRHTVISAEGEVTEQSVQWNVSPLKAQ